MTAGGGREKDRERHEKDGRVEINAPRRHNGGDWTETAAVHVDPLPEDCRFGDKEGGTHQGDPQGGEPGQHTEEKAESTEELDEWEGPSEGDGERNREYPEVVYQEDRVVPDIDEFAG